MMADTDEKINEYIEKSLNYLSAIGRPIDLKYEQRISIQHLFLGKDVIAILPTGVGKCTIFTVHFYKTQNNWNSAIYGVSIILCFIKILYGSRNFFTVYALTKISWHVQKPETPKRNHRNETTVTTETTKPK